MITRKCKECGKEFTLSDSEINFYKEKNLELPKRCSECRKKNKINDMDSNNNLQENKTANTVKHKNIFKSLIALVVVLVLGFTGKSLDLFDGYFGRQDNAVENTASLSFRSEKLLDEHFEKHKSEFNYSTKEQYVKGANDIINSSSSLHKTENEDGDDIYYDKDKNEIVFVSGDGYIRSYFKPNDGIKYYNRQ